jgi:ring-1,2-phenylacetyl-CoA epoxidase subunit PaaD
MDPEVPVLSVVELGIVREIGRDGDGSLVVSLTPTYSGCPAMRTIETDITEALAHAGFNAVRLRTIYSPVWTSDWIGAEAREKLRLYGIAMEGASATGHGSGAGQLRGSGSSELVPLRRAAPLVSCPYCGSRATEMRSEFGSTACKAVMYCTQCRQPFELFKSIYRIRDLHDGEPGESDRGTR